MKTHYQMKFSIISRILVGVCMCVCGGSNSTAPVNSSGIDLEVVAMKWYSILLRAPGLEPHHQMVQCHIQDTRQCVCVCVGGSYLSSEMQSVCSKAWYDTRQFDGDGPVMLELWVMLSTPLMLSLPGPLWPGVVAPDQFLSMGQIELNCVLMLNWTVWNWTTYTYKNGFGIK